MKIGNLILLWLAAIVVWGFVCVLGWGVSFAFTYNVFVPWLGVPAEWHNAVSFATAFIFDGIASILLLLFLVLCGLGVYKLTSRKSRG
jgi:hypothetical protein